VTALGFFESVEVSHKPGSDNARVVIQVEVKEKATGTFQVGLGFSNAESFIFTAQISQNNFLGWGQSVSASAQLSGLRSLVQLSFYDPYFLDTNYIFSADFYRMETQYPGFTRRSTGGNVTLGYHILEDVMLNLTLTREFVQNEADTNFQADIPLANQFRDGSTSSMRVSGTWDRRDNRLFATKGFMHFASVEWAPKLPGILGGSFNFTRYTAYTRWYYPIIWGAVAKANVTLGYMQQHSAESPLPVSEMYVLGGINSVRGYQLRTISPTLLVGNSTTPDSRVDRLIIGGDKQFILNAELEIPIFEKVGIRGVLFYDAGNAFAKNARFFEDRQNQLPLGLFHSIGWGFRWFSPIGPLRFEWGIPLNKRTTDEPVLFEFTIGNFF
jgi:outer membrane protein insertion porin family